MNKANAQKTLDNFDSDQIKPAITIRPTIEPQENTMGGIESGVLNISVIDEIATSPLSSLISESFEWTGLSSDRIKQINREITRKTPPDIKVTLLNEHDILVRQKFKEGLSIKEEKRLSYIRWQLDNIEDAEHGEELDRLKYFTEGIETFAGEIEKLLMKFDPSKDKRKSFKK